MPTRSFLGVLAGVVWALTATAQSNPSVPKVAVLDLDIAQGVTAEADARSAFKSSSQAELLNPPAAGDRPSNLIALLGCPSMDAPCLKRVATSLKAKFVIFGELSASGDKETLVVKLYSFDDDKIVATEQASFAPGERKEGFQKTIHKLLEVNTASAIRVPTETTPPNGNGNKKGPRFAIPGALFAASAGLGAPAVAIKFGIVLNTDRNESPQENGLRTAAGLASDICLVGAIATTVIMLTRKAPAPTEATASK